MTKAITTQPANHPANHPITTQILAQVKSIDITLPEAIDDKWAEIEQAEAQLAVHVAKLGLRYMDLREAVGHGEFSKALELRGIEQRTVQNHMRITKFFMDMTDSNTKTSSHLKPSQILELAKLPDEEKQALTPERIEEYGQMSVRTLRAEVKQLRLQFDEQHSVQAENERLKQQLKESQQDYAQQVTINNHEQLKKKPETIYGIHAEVAHTRERAIAIAELLTTVSVEINQLVQRCTNSELAPELGRDCALAINTSLSGQIMQLANSLNTLHESHGKDVLTTPDNLPVYSAIEVSEALGNAEYAKGQFKATIGAL